MHNVIVCQDKIAFSGAFYRRLCGGSAEVLVLDGEITICYLDLQRIYCGQKINVFISMRDNEYYDIDALRNRLKSLSFTPYIIETKKTFMHYLSKDKAAFIKAFPSCGSIETYCQGYASGKRPHVVKTDDEILAGFDVRMLVEGLEEFSELLEIMH